ncbi:MAG: hypothetical protein LBO05_02710 [Deltaproteobacteria bacterium]|jgi:uncharacterized protein YaaW (UPF0174 family)|nr:hypothetical protein [Deltaproteobacteria bacterium]
MSNDPSTTSAITLLKKIEAAEPGNDLLQALCKRHGESEPEGLVKDLCQDASNTVGWILTGPAGYAECVRRAAVKIGLKEEELSEDVTVNELNILQACLRKHFESMDPVEREKARLEILEDIGKENEETFKTVLEGTAASILILLNAVGAQVVRRIVFRIFVVFLSRQAVLTTARLAAMAVPFVNVLVAAWLVVDIVGPAYRKIVPSVCNIALLRLTQSD